MAPHSSTLAWTIPWTEEPGGPQSMGSLQSDTTERLHFHFSLSCIGEDNGNSLQCSCLENPRDGKPGGLPSMGSHRVGHDWSDLTAAAVAINGSSKNNLWKKKPFKYTEILWPHRQKPMRLPHPWDSSGKNTGVGCHFLLQYSVYLTLTLVEILYSDTVFLPGLRSVN